MPLRLCVCVCLLHALKFLLYLTTLCYVFENYCFLYPSTPCLFPKHLLPPTFFVVDLYS